MREPRLAWIVALTALTAAAAACTTATTSGPSGPTGDTPAAGTPTTGTPPPKIPPKGDPADPGTPTTSELNFTNDPNAPACTGQPGELYALSAKVLTVGTDVPLCRTQGKVLLIVNVASHCGNTPQYAPLQALYAKYKAQGFYVLGFPTPEFGGQEFADEKEVTKFCTDTYKITFPLFAIADVNGAAPQPVYSWIKSQPGYNRDVQWNFEKYLVDRKGKIVQRIENGVEPDDPAVISAIEAEIAKP